MNAIIVWTTQLTQHHERTNNRTRKKQKWMKKKKKKKRRIYMKNSNNEMEWRKITFPMGYACMPVVDLHMVAYLQTTHTKSDERNYAGDRDPKHDKSVSATKERLAEFFFLSSILQWNAYSHAHFSSVTMTVQLCRKEHIFLDRLHTFRMVFGNKEMWA